MTRCYEFYAMFKKTPERCEIKDRTSLWRVDKYMEQFEEKGVKFDYNEDDKDLFYKLHDEIGSEHQVGRVGDHQPLVECASCGMGTREATLKDGRNYCPNCIEDVGRKGSSQPQRTEKKLYKPTWQERKAQMHPEVSKMEEAIRLRLEEAKIPFQANHEFCVVHTKPDFYFPSKNLAIYLDGEKVHMKREGKDERLRELLQKQHGIKSVAIVYKDNSKLTENEIFKQILEVVK